jgi:hypothetical protein
VLLEILDLLEHLEYLMLLVLPAHLGILVHLERLEHQ